MHVVKRHESIQAKINKIMKDIIKVKCNNLYAELVNKKYTMPKCVWHFPVRCRFCLDVWMQLKKGRRMLRHLL